jgi:hypothetical protein
MPTTAPNTATGSKTASATLKAFQEKVTAQMHDAKAKLDELEARAKEKRAQAQLTAVNNLKATREHISKKVQDLKTTHASNVARAKADIDEAVAEFKSAISKVK